MSIRRLWVRDLELLARLLVDVRAAQHRVLVDARGQRDRARHARTGAHRGIDDLTGALVEQLVKSYAFMRMRIFGDARSLP